MATVTGATVVTRTGASVLAHAFGNNIAVICPKCGKHPILLVARTNQRGSDAAHPSQCGGCQARVWMISSVSGTLTAVTIDFR